MSSTSSAGKRSRQGRCHKRKPSYVTTPIRTNCGNDHASSLCDPTGCAGGVGGGIEAVSLLPRLTPPLLGQVGRTAQTGFEDEDAAAIAEGRTRTTNGSGRRSRKRRAISRRTCGSVQIPLLPGGDDYEDEDDDHCREQLRLLSFPDPMGSVKFRSASHHQHRKVGLETQQSQTQSQPQRPGSQLCFSPFRSNAADALATSSFRRDNKASSALSSGTTCLSPLFAAHRIGATSSRGAVSLYDDRLSQMASKKPSKSSSASPHHRSRSNRDNKNEAPPNEEEETSLNNDFASSATSSPADGSSSSSSLRSASSPDDLHSGIGNLKAVAFAPGTTAPNRIRTASGSTTGGSSTASSTGMTTASTTTSSPIATSMSSSSTTTRQNFHSARSHRTFRGVSPSSSVSEEEDAVAQGPSNAIALPNLLLDIALPTLPSFVEGPLSALTPMPSHGRRDSRRARRGNNNNGTITAAHHHKKRTAALRPRPSRRRRATLRLPMRSSGNGTNAAATTTTTMTTPPSLFGIVDSAPTMPYLPPEPGVEIDDIVGTSHNGNKAASVLFDVKGPHTHGDDGKGMVALSPFQAFARSVEEEVKQREAEQTRPNASASPIMPVF